LNAVTVKLYLMHPSRPVGRSLYAFAELRRNKIGEIQ
jgi:hypothetical protein